MLGWETPRKSASTPLAHPACGAADSKRPRSKDVCWLVVVPAMARRNIEWCGRVESHGREG